MNKIVFPSINLKLTVNNVAIKIFNIEIYWYAILIIASIILSIILCKKECKKYNIKYEDILELFIYIMPISIIFARIYYVIFSLNKYINNPMEIFNFRNGGLAIYGGIIGGILTIYVYTKIKKINFWNILDILAPYLALSQAIGRWGNFFNQEAHGIETTSIFRMGIIENGKYIEVHPTFLYESICNFIIFIILNKMSKNRKYEGQITYMYLTLYAFIRMIIEGLRTDSLMLGNIRISQILSIIIFLVSTIILIYKRKNVGEKKIEE